MTRLSCALALMLASVAHSADRLVIVPSDGGECRLLLPRDFLKRHKATPIKRQSVGLGSPSLPTILAGLALAVAVILAGLLLMKRPATRLVTGSLACVVAGMLFLNSSCSPRPGPIDDPNVYRRSSSAPHRSTNPPTVNEDGTLAGEMLLEEGQVGDALRLVIDEETLKGLKEK